MLLIDFVTIALLLLSEQSFSASIFDSFDFDHISEFTSFVNINNQGELFGEKISNKKIIYDLDSKKACCLAIFDKNQGYVVLDKQNSIISYSTEIIDLTKYFNFDLFISNNDLFYLNNDGLSQITFNDECPNWIDNSFEYGYANWNDSIIEYNNLDSYVQNKYSNLVFSTSTSDKLDGLGSFYCDGYTQWNESVFSAGDNGTYTEGNCGIVSVANGLAYCSRYGGKSYLPLFDSYSTVYPYLEVPNVCEDALAKGYTPKNTSVAIHTISSMVRKYAVINGYDVGGMNDPQTTSAFVGACSYYGYTNSVFNVPSSFTKNDIISRVVQNGPMQLRTNDDNVYGGHGMFITGYKDYVIYLPINSRYRIKGNVFCVSVLDGWSNRERWYDMETLSKNIPLKKIEARAKSVSIAYMEVA